MPVPISQITHADPVFQRAIRAVLKHEGGWVDDPDDPGGATKYGVSLRYARQVGDLDGDGHLDMDVDGDGDVDANDIRRLTVELAVDLYYRDWWCRRPAFAAIGEINAELAAKLFDLSINMGHRQAVKLLQRALGVAADGLVGPATLVVIRRCAAEGWVLVEHLKLEAADFYRDLAGRHPKSRKYLSGWLNRANAEV